MRSRRLAFPASSSAGSGSSAETSSLTSGASISASMSSPETSPCDVSSWPAPSSGRLSASFRPRRRPRLRLLPCPSSANCFSFRLLLAGPLSAGRAPEPLVHLIHRPHVGVLAGISRRGEPGVQYLASARLGCGAQTQAENVRLVPGLRTAGSLSVAAEGRARTPGTLFAAIETPVPVQQNSTASSALPDATAAAASPATTGQAEGACSSRSGPNSCTSKPRLRSSCSTKSVTCVRSSLPSAIRAFLSFIRGGVPTKSRVRFNYRQPSGYTAKRAVRLAAPIMGR